MSAPSSSSKPSENEQIKVNVQMPDVKSQKKGRKHQMIYYISDEDIRHLKKKTRFTEGDLRYNFCLFCRYSYWKELIA